MPEGVRMGATVKSSMASHTQLFIDGAWSDGVNGRTIPVMNPATGEAGGTVAQAEKTDLDLALAAVERGFHTWRKISAFERSKMMRSAADLVRQRVDAIARTLTAEQGKPLSEAKGEV